MRAATQATQTSARPLAPATICLAAAAAVTERIGLLTNIFIAPVRPPTVFAKEVATLSRLASPAGTSTRAEWDTYLGEIDQYRANCPAFR